MGLGERFKYFSSTVGWIVGPVIALIGLVNQDLPYNGMVMLLGVLIWWLAAGISYSLHKEAEAAKPAEEHEDSSE
jgi:hypothetical protein